MSIKAVFFDLDYTLYDMERYLRGAYRDVAQRLEERSTLGAEELYASLLNVWQRVGTDYGFLFNDWLQENGLLSQENVRSCIDVFHSHRPVLELYPGVKGTLDRLRKDHFLGLVTDGDLQMQRSKVAALELKGRFDVIVYSAELGVSKPDARVFRCAIELAGVRIGEAAFVGDHPIRDMVGARQTGLLAIRTLSGEFGALPDDPSYPPNHRLDTISELPDLLAEIEETIAPGR